MKKVPVCEEAYDGDVNEWMETDVQVSLLSNKEIVEVVKAKKEKYEDESEDEEKTDNGEETRRTYVDENALRYFEQQDTLLIDICFFCTVYEMKQRNAESSARSKRVLPFFSKK